MPVGDSNSRVSPKFPNIAEARARRQRHRENTAARLLFVSLVVSLLYSIIWQNPTWLIVSGFSFLGFVLTVVVACWRYHGRISGDV